MNGPYIDANGNQVWSNSGGKLHREDGPAVIWAFGAKEWYVDGKRKIKNSTFQKAAKLTDEDMLMITLKYGDVK